MQTVCLIKSRMVVGVEIEWMGRREGRVGTYASPQAVQAGTGSGRQPEEVAIRQRLHLLLPFFPPLGAWGRYRNGQ
jgi:hypothetical protein